MQYFWDPEPANNTSSKEVIWCLGKEYKPFKPTKTSKPTLIPQDSEGISVDPGRPARPATPPDSAASSQGSAIACDEFGSDDEGGWPTAFLEDFEAKIWVTYRSGFPAIPKSRDPKAPLSMSIAVRLRSQLVESAGFTSDTGWGCMIRSGQSLLANTLLILRMGRGRLSLLYVEGVELTIGRLATWLFGFGRTKDNIPICRRSQGPLFDTQIC